MPLIVDGALGLAKWPGRNDSRGSRPAGQAWTECIRIALINNMPDSALEDTELQFFELLDKASDNISVRLTLFSLPNIPRSDKGRQRLSEYYSGVDELLKHRFDAVIVTGTEPQQPDLRQEPYWSDLVDVFDWAQENTASAVLSCLAAHGGVLHYDGIDRFPLSCKRFGVFHTRTVCRDALTARVGDTMRFPHSRWNEVRADVLTSAWLRDFNSFGQRRRRSVCQETKEKPLRTFPRTPGVWPIDPPQGISKRCEKISAAGKGNLSFDAPRIFRLGGFRSSP